jgi:hypothetical protein
MADFIERQLSRAFGNDHLPIFSHSDLQRKNIIVREIPLGDKNTLTKKTYVVSIVDWEIAGWYNLIDLIILHTSLIDYGKCVINPTGDIDSFKRTILVCYLD